MVEYVYNVDTLIDVDKWWATVKQQEKNDDVNNSEKVCGRRRKEAAMLVLVLVSEQPSAHTLETVTQHCAA